MWVITWLVSWHESIYTDSTETSDPNMHKTSLTHFAQIFKIDHYVCFCILHKFESFVN